MSGKSAARPATAIEYAIAVVAARSLPEKKLREKLLARYGSGETEAALVRMRELRLVDDAAWAERFARDRLERTGKGSHRIRSELLARGIEGSTAEAAIAVAVGPQREQQKAAAVLETLRARLDRGRGASHPTDAGANPHPQASRHDADKLRSRLFRRMIARGYPASLVRDLLDVS